MLRFTAELIYGSSAVAGAYEYDNPTIVTLLTVADLERLSSLWSAALLNGRINKKYSFQICWRFCCLVLAHG